MARQCRSRNKSVTGENGTKAQKSLKHDTSIICEISKKVNMTKESIIYREKLVYFADFRVGQIFYMYKTYIKYITIRLKMVNKHTKKQF